MYVCGDCDCGLEYLWEKKGGAGRKGSCFAGHRSQQPAPSYTTTYHDHNQHHLPTQQLTITIIITTITWECTSYMTSCSSYHQVGIRVGQQDNHSSSEPSKHGIELKWLHH